MKNLSTIALLLSFGLLITRPAWATNVTIDGTIQTSTVTLGNGDSLSVTATGTLNVSASKADAVDITGTSTISNLGIIEATFPGKNAGRAIRDNASGSVSVSITNGSLSNSTALIESIDNDAFQMNVAGHSVFLANYGKIVTLTQTSGGGQAIDWNALNTTTGSNTLYNYYSGMILSTDADSVRPGVNGVVMNSGTIKSSILTDVGGGDDGIDAQNNTGISITNDALVTTGTNATNLIEGARHGITGSQSSATATFTMSITNNANGTIKGDNGSGVNIDGYNANEVVTINNAGTIIGNGTSLSGTNTAQDGDGVDVDGVVNITNSGTIKSLNAINDTSEGVTVGGGTITNSGTIEGSVATPTGSNTAVGRGITLAGLDKDPTTDQPIPIEKTYAPSIIINSGLIKGDTDAGIAIRGVNTTPTGSYTAQTFDVTITNTLGGIIEGGGAVAAIDGGAMVDTETTPIASMNNETVINYGTIRADGTGKAISLGSGNNSVQILGGAASVIGDMSGGTLTGTNTAALTIDPTTGQSFSYGGVISNFTSVQIKSGTVTLSGTNTYTGATSVTGGKLAVNGSLVGNVAVSAGAELGGHGTIGGTISGAGAVGPGNSPGILTTSSVDPTGGMSFNFELTQVGAPSWGNAASSGNDVLHLTGATPFTAALTSANTVDLYFSGLNLTYQGGFFVEGSTDTLTAKLASATFDYFVLDNTNGTIRYNGNLYDQVTGMATTVQVTGVNFGSGPIDGWTEQFTAQAAPEPATYLMLGMGALIMVLVSRRRNRLS